jgi:hypothetical protein
MFQNFFNLLLIVSMLIGPLAGVHIQPQQQTEMQWVIYDTLDNPSLPAGLEVVEDYGSFVLGRMPADGIKAGINGLEILTDRTRVSLSNVEFDSAQGEPAIPDALRAAAADPYFLVQFIGPIKTEWLDALQASGAAIIGYTPNYTYIVRMDPALLDSLKGMRAVQWVGQYHPAYRMPVEAELKQAETQDGLLALTVRLFEGEDENTLLNNLAAQGAQVIGFSSETHQARVWIAPEQIASLAAVPGVYLLEAYVAPTLDNEKAGQVMHTFNVRSASRNRLGVDLTGAGPVAGMVDSGLDLNTTAPAILDFYDFTSGVQTTRIQAAVAGNGCGVGGCTCSSTDDAVSSGHGTHVAGSIVGNGYLSLMQQGLQAQARTADPSFDYAFGVGQAPEARIVAAYTAGTNGSLCGIGTTSAFNTWVSVYNAGARNVNNSWGSAAYTYAGESYTADRVMWTYQDYLLVVSAGNNGPSWTTIGQPGTAKNVIAVGASGNHRSVWDFTSSTASLLTDFSSRGPVSGSTDRRAKPDIVAPGADVLSTRSTTVLNTELTLWGNEPGDGDANGHLDYWWSGGTSMSSPQITGAATVVRDYLQDIQGLGSTTPPSAALVKGFLLNGAVDMGYGYEFNAASPWGGRNMQGWGMANLEQSIAPRAPRSFFFDDFTNISDTVHQSTRGMNSSGDYVQYTISVVNSSEPLKVTLNWTDPQTGTTAGLVNNLNLLVTAPGGTQYYGNSFTGSWSNTTATTDTLNNVESVYLQNPALGSWTIRVTSATIGTGTQPFALVASGGFGASPSYIRTCSGTTDCLGRMGTSARSYYPSLTQLSGTQEHTPPGSAFTTSVRLTNGGTSADTLSLSAAYTDKTGAAASGISASYSPAGPYSLASGASQDVQVTVIVGTGVATGVYDVALTATSAGNSAARDAQVIGLNVIPSTSLYNEKAVVTDTGAQFSPDLWANGQNIWTAYVSAQSHNAGEAEIYAACSADGGATWSKTQIDANNGTYYGKPMIAGKADGSYVTVIWNTGDSFNLYARTWTRTSGCTGSWGTQQTLATTSGTNALLQYDVIVDNDGNILAVWRYYPNGIYSSQSTNNGTSWSAAAAVPNASGASSNHAMPSLALDTVNNDVWLAYARTVSGTNRDIYIKRWNGTTNAWAAAGTQHIAVSTSTNREVYPGIAVNNGAIWVSWNRYLDYSAPTARLYYARSGGTLPNPTFSTIYGPYATRVAEYTLPAITGDASSVYISYLAYTDALRGGNVYLLTIPAAGGAPSATTQVTATVDDPPFNARGNAGSPLVAWATTTLNGKSFTGPTLLYAKNPPNNENPNYATNLGTAQTLFNLEENVDIYLAQLSPAVIGNTYADTAGLCALNEPCYITFQGAVNDVGTSGSTYAYASLYNEALTLNKSATITMLGDATLANLNMTAGVFNASATNILTFTGNFIHTGGTFNHNNGTVAFTGTGVQTITGNTDFYNVNVGANSVLTTTYLVGRAGSLTNLGWTDETRSIGGTGSVSYGLAGVSVNLTAQGTLSSLQVRRRDTNHPGATGGVQTGKYWQITATGAGFTADLSLPHNALLDPKICRYLSGSTWDCARNSFNTTTVTRLALTAFSEWAVGNNVPTAVRLTSLSASAAPAPWWPWLAGVGLLLGLLVVLRRKNL